MPYTLDFSLALGSSQTGLTLKAILVDSSGVDVGSEITTGFTEIGAGNYLWHYAAFPDGHRGGVKFYVGTLPTGLKAFAAINPEEAENLDAKITTVAEASDPLTNQVPGDYESGTAGAALGRIGVGSIKVTNALTPGGDLYLVKGDDYTVESARAIEFTDAESEVKWTDLTDATVVIILQDTPIAGEVVTPTGGAKLVRFEFTAEETAALSTDESRYAVVATLANEETATLTRGRQFTYDNSSNA